MEKILVIEDEKNIILTLKMLLKNHDFETRFTKSGSEGIQIIEDFNPDIILLDILLPDMNGYLICEAIRENYTKKELPIIFMSAKSEEKDIQKAYNLGGNDYIVKPFENEELIRRINKILEG
ncbi:MAG: response regulator [Bacillota bacterium]